MAKGSGAGRVLVLSLSSALAGFSPWSSRMAQRVVSFCSPREPQSRRSELTFANCPLTFQWCAPPYMHPHACMHMHKHTEQINKMLFKERKTLHVWGWRDRVGGGCKGLALLRVLQIRGSSGSWGPLGPEV